MTSAAPRRRRWIPVIAVTIGLLASGVLIATESGTAQAAPVATAKVKCVNTATGVARYSSTGKCRRGERKEERTCAKGGHCVLGDIGPGRGIVFYTAGGEQPWGRYLEAAPPTWKSAAGDPRLPWCQDTTHLIPGTGGSGLGDGAANTTAMLTVCTSGAGFAAGTYTGIGLDDWYLPSIGEVNAFRTAREVIPRFFATLANEDFWSSSENLVDAAWTLSVASIDAEPVLSGKSLPSFVRPIRAF